MPKNRLIAGTDAEAGGRTLGLCYHHFRSHHCQPISDRQWCLTVMVMIQALVVMLCWSSALATERPIIGILFQEPSKSISSLLPHAASYLPASYVRAVQAAGARVVPIHLNRTQDYYRSVVSSVNGLILPGGNTWFYGHEGGYADSGDLLLREAISLNNNGIHFPVIGICLGFELLLFLDNGRQEYRSSCFSKNISMPLILKADFATSKLFQGASSELINILRTESVTFNQHGFCVTERNLTLKGLSEHWKVISTNQDPISGQEFISIIESKKYPFLGVQFHPEKNSFEWKKNLNIPHFPHAIMTSRFFFDWLVSQARLNNNSFSNETEEETSLIYNYPTYYTKGALPFDEIYIYSGLLPLSAFGSSSSNVWALSYVFLSVIIVAVLALVNNT